MSELPIKWGSYELGELFSFVIGGDWGKAPDYNNEDFVDVLCIRGTEFRNWNKDKGSTASHRRIKLASLEKRSLKKGDILIEISGGGPDQPVGRTVLIDSDVLEYKPRTSKVCTNFLRLARPVALISPSYLNFYLHNFYMSGEIIKYQGGSNNLRNLKFKYYSKITIPIAPLNEQNRIADTLHSLLSKLETTQKHLDNIPHILKRFRQSVLTAAVSGQLTAGWRHENQLHYNQWKNRTFNDLCKEITVGFVGKMKDQYKESGIPFLRSQNVRAFKFSSKNLLYISKEFHQNIIKSQLEAGNLAIVRSGAPGTTCVIPKSLGIANCSDLVIARPGKDLNPHFAAIYMNSEIGKAHVTSKQVGVAQQHFNVGSMKKTIINLPSNEEQSEIVRQVQSLFKLSDQVEQKYQSAKQRTDKLTRSILAKAFRGELVPQDQSDEPASELIKRIKAEKLEKSKPIKSNKIISNILLNETARKPKMIIPVLQALKEANKPLTGQELFAFAGYPNNAEAKLVEEYFLDLRNQLEKQLILRKRDTNKNQDVFDLMSKS